MVQVHRVHNTLVPFKREWMFVTGFSEGIYSLADVSDRSCIEPAESLAGKDAEPHLDLVQPGSMGRDVMEMNTGVSR